MRHRYNTCLTKFLTDQQKRDLSLEPEELAQQDHDSLVIEETKDPLGQRVLSDGEPQSVVADLRSLT